MNSFGELAKNFKTKLICNYVLFSYPNGENNYSAEHAIKLAQLIDKDSMKINLGVYSETGKGFVSPDEKAYRFLYYCLNQKYGIETEIVKLYGQDVNAACGMLNYQEDTAHQCCDSVILSK